MADLFDDASGNGKRREVATYDYTDEAGKLLFQVVRFEPKDFRQRKPDGHGGWEWKLGDTPRVLYRLPAVLEAVRAGRTVFVVEGEKDVATLVGWGLDATCNPGGAGKGKWRPEYNESLYGAKVVIIPDADDVGREHAASIARSLAPRARKVQTVELPGAKDASAWAAAGGTREALLTLCSPNDDDVVQALSAHIALSAQWPEKMSAEAMHGITGAFVHEVEPHTEADEAALLVQFLVAAGCALGAGPHMMVGADRHTARLFAVLVGTTSRGRKGSSEGWVRRIIADATPGWGEHVVGGLSTGEGLIWTVRDPIYEYQTTKARKGEPAGEPQLVMTDPGVDDKRLLIVESEYARLLKVAERDGNTVSPIIRQAWDSGDLRVMTRSSPAVATGAHISIIGHVTAEELRRRLTETEVANGLANRFMWVCTRRSKLLPDGGTLRPEDLLYLARDLGERLASARTIGEVRRSQAAGELWREAYPDLTREVGGLYGAVTARAEAQVLRLSLLYALLDASRTIEPQHLHAALAVWRYCDQSARHIFGDALGDPVADEILRALAGAAQGLTRNELRDLFSRHVGAGRLTTALEYLASVGRAICSSEPTGGRPSERWRISTPHGAVSAESAESPTRDREPGDDDDKEMA